MRRALPGLAVLAAALASSGCKAGAYYEAAEKQRASNPDAAIEYLARCLEVEPANEKALAMLNEIGKKIAADHAERENELDRSKRYEDAVAQCDRVIATKDLISHCPGNVDIIHEAAERSRFAEKAAEKLYNEGMNLRSQNAKEAARRFRLANAFSPGYKDAQALYDQTVSAAKTRVAVEVFAGAGGGEKITQACTDAFVKKIVEKNPEFLEIVQQGGAGIGKLTGKVSTTWRDSGWKAKKGQNSADVKVRNPDGTWALDANGNVLVQTVTCTWVLHERSTSLDFQLSYTVIDEKGATRDAATASRSDKDYRDYVSDIQGDENALPYEVSQRPRQKVEPRGFDDSAGVCLPHCVEELCQKLFRKFK